MNKVQGKWICGFWRRIGALFVDSLLLGILGYILGFFLEDVFVELGGWSRLVGFSISITYFGVMNSAIANGQTIGKKILNIKVVDKSNSTISLGKSFLRYSFLAIPFSLNGAQIDNEVLLPYLVYPLSFIIFGGLMSITYLYIFNRVTRQSLHDLALGTFVVNTANPYEELPAIWKPHLVIVTGILVVATLLPVFTSDFVEGETIKNLLVTQGAINNNPSVKYSSVTEGLTSFISSEKVSTTTTYVNAQAYLYKNNVQDTVIANKLAQTVISTYPESLSKDLIQVTLIYGYDIGIASVWYNHNYRFDPKEVKAE